MFNKLAATAGAFALMACLSPGANAYTIQAQVVPPASVPFSLVNLGAAGGAGQFVSGSTVMISGETISFGGPHAAAGDAGVYYGDIANVTKSPFDGTTLTPMNYLSAEPNGSVTITFATPQTAFDLLWGSVDDYNSVSFGFGPGQTITGTDIAAAVAGINFGTTNAAVEISGLAAFSSLTISSTSAAFEFVPGAPVPEPASLMLLGGSLMGLAALKRRRQNRA